VGLQNPEPLVKPQFALGCYGGQGMGKNFVLHQLPQRILGMSVKETTAEELFGDTFALNAALGASFLVVNEVKDLVNFSLAKGLARSEWHEVNTQVRGQGPAAILAIPIYLTNETHPQVQSRRRDRSHALHHPRPDPGEHGAVASGMGGLQDCGASSR
jgi:hypothetical protein